MSYQEKYPPDFVIPGSALKYLEIALTEFNKLIKSNFTVEKYEIYYSEYDEENYVSLSFLPQPTPTFREAKYFEIPYHGSYENGPGVTYFVSKDEFKILKTTYMR